MVSPVVVGPVEHLLSSCSRVQPPRVVVVAGDAQARREIPPDVHRVAVRVQGLEPKLNLADAVGTAGAATVGGIIERHRNGAINQVEVEEFKVALRVRSRWEPKE